MDRRDFLSGLLSLSVVPKREIFGRTRTSEFYTTTCCPECRVIMARFVGDNGKNYVYCMNPKCSLYKRLFKHPTIELEQTPYYVGHDSSSVREG